MPHYSSNPPRQNPIGYIIRPTQPQQRTNGTDSELPPKQRPRIQQRTAQFGAPVPVFQRIGPAAQIVAAGQFARAFPCVVHRAANAGVARRYARHGVAPENDAACTAAENSGNQSAYPPNPSVSATAQHCAESARQPPVRPASGANAGTDGAESGGIAQAVAGIAPARAAFVRTRISVYKILLSIDTKQCAKYYARSITAFMKRMTYFGRPDI